MPFEPGKTKTGGRVAGQPNKSTAKAREAIASFVDDNAHRLTLWLDEIAAKDPKDAFNCFQSIIEYHIPKLARGELQHEGNIGLTVNIKRLTDGN